MAGSRLTVTLNLSVQLICMQSLDIKYQLLTTEIIPNNKAILTRDWY